MTDETIKCVADDYDSRNERFTLDATMEFVKRVADVLEFDLDPAASHASHKAKTYYTRCDDGLSLPWHGNVFVNPPYDNLGPWVNKAFKEIVNCKKIVMLVPANRTEQPWWQDNVEPYRDSAIYGVDKYPLETIFIPKRVKFGTPEDPKGARKGNSPMFGCVLLIWTNNVICDESSNAVVVDLADYNERCAA